MATNVLEQLDSFPYRHRVSDLMAAPLVTLPGDATVAEAARHMAECRVSSIVVLDESGQAAGILTERDVLRLVARDVGSVAGPVAGTMSRPVWTIPASALIYRALARMARLGVRHLPAVDPTGRPVGMLTAGALLKQRATAALTLGDEIEQATDATGLRAAHEKLPSLATALRSEDVPATQVSAVIAGVVCDLTARAAEMALSSLRAEGRGEPPARWCLLVLGSAGRGESLLAADQDNALVHDGDSSHDGWFVAFGERVNTLLAAAGIPLCAGGVMAGRPAFCRSLAAWCDVVDGWVARPRPEALMNVDIFYDFVPVLGASDLGDALRRHATEAAAGSPVFLRLMADAGERLASPFDLLGRLRTKNGRIDLKRHGLFPIVTAARTIALAWKLQATATDERLRYAVVAGRVSADSVAELASARATIVNAILDQQLADRASGAETGNLVTPRRLSRPALRNLRHALETAATAPDLVRQALSTRAPERAP